MAATQLIIQADDFGMCHAVNQGIAQSFQSGILTQTSMMAPCPWISEAAALAIDLDLPVGTHGTLTCEWDYLRWRPLTHGRSLVESDGTMHKTLESAIEKVDGAEATDELCAQVESLRAFGLKPGYLDCHMGPSTREGFSEACRLSGLRFIYPLVDECFSFESIAMLSPMPAEQKKPWLIDRLEGFEPGVHLIVTHPSVDDAEIRSIARPDADNYCWAEENRTSDLAVLLDSEVAARIEALGIELVSVEDL
jgi:predicted glycoside hydrolase/deacetylase ChbG (UPF0249 family)